ncbi:patatin-like phospholipase family protein [Streptomyces sp. NPDC048637]|uniref:patatin-like phospholipase family protein n=1 Tax=Streptomyces sp. NPDC048637 TaxID=3155636 RepID=UPI0034252B14
MIGHQATRGIVALSPPGATGGGTDVLRRTSLAARTDPTGALADMVEDFFPTEPRTDLFQPEPGCSDATFTGSAADVAALAGQLMTGILHALNAPDGQHTMAALTVRTPSGPTDPQPAGPRWLTWPNDTTITDDATGYDVRIAPAALAEMRAEARRGARVRGPRVETGGMLLGTIDDATGIIHVDEATGPPPDSLLSDTYFQHGLDGVTHHLASRRTATGNTSRFLGLWHTHPHTPAQPSATDRTAMELLTLPLDDAPTRALVLIAGGPPPVWQKWLTTADGPDLYARLATRTTTAATPPAPTAPAGHPGPGLWWPGGYATRPATDNTLPAPPPIGRRPPMTRTLGLALSGGGSRAAAFHLGCLRALHDRDLLDRIRVVSGISGGSLLAALWAYGPPDFADFDTRTTDLLRSGLQLAIARQAFTPSAVARNLTAAARAGARGAFTRGSDVSVARPANRTDALAAVLARQAFGTRTMADVTHPGLDVVLTATDLATTNAVRFGSTRSGCSRYGTITEPIPAATAVAASAAYPALLPALERTFTFQHRDGHHQQHTVLLTDGGVYDNLGLSVLEPGRSPHHTQHVYDVPFIIACDAGQGELTLKAPHFRPDASAAPSPPSTAKPRTPPAPACTNGPRADASTDSPWPTSA